jgi:NAD(P)H dehydrogenase (quinone)
MPSPAIAIVYHSGYGHTKAVAEHILKGAQGVSGVNALLISVDELPAPNADRSMGGRWNELAAADAIIMGSPTYMGDVSWKFKQFMEYSSGIWFQQGWKDKLAAGFTNSGSLSGDKLHALSTISVFAAQHSMVWVGTGITSKGTAPTDLNRVGSYMGLMTQSDTAPADVTPPSGDRQTAELFGARVAQATLRWTKGK